MASQASRLTPNHTAYLDLGIGRVLPGERQTGGLGLAVARALLGPPVVQARPPAPYWYTRPRVLVPGARQPLGQRDGRQSLDRRPRERARIQLGNQTAELLALRRR
jgi:hypothetical protein